VGPAGTGASVFSSPAVANGIVYIGSENGNVYAFRAATGAAALWTFSTGGAVFSSPAVANGVVYIGAGDGNLYALDAGTGSMLWRAATGNEVNSSPAVSCPTVRSTSAPTTAIFTLSPWGRGPRLPGGRGWARSARTTAFRCFVFVMSADRVPLTVIKEQHPALSSQVRKCRAVFIRNRVRPPHRHGGRLTIGRRPYQGIGGVCG
jgi:putative pyrroloquinoline-quinone binding quinoprotein